MKNGSTDSDGEKKRRPRRKSLKKDKNTEHKSRKATIGKHDIFQVYFLNY